MSNSPLKTLALVAATALAFASSSALAETTINIAGWGAKSGPLRSFGVNSEAVMKAAVARVNETGGIKLKNGSKAKLAFDYHDSACNAEQAIAVARKVASESNALVGIGPTCSGAAAAMFGVFQKKVGDSGDTVSSFQS